MPNPSHPLLFYNRNNIWQIKSYGAQWQYKNNDSSDQFNLFITEFANSKEPITGKH
jgi:hypothetical protein